MAEEYLTLEECASFLKVSTRTIRRWINKGALPAIKVEKTIRILKSELDRLGKHIQSPKEELSQDSERKNLRELSASAFNRIWDNEVDAETWDSWRPSDARP